MAITNEARLKEVQDAVDTLLHTVQNDEDLAKEIPKWLTGKYASYQYVYEKMHQAVSATCEALGHKDLTAIIPAQVTEVTAKEYWVETKVLVNFIEANFAGADPPQGPKLGRQTGHRPLRDKDLPARFFIARNWFALRGHREALANILPENALQPETISGIRAIAADDVLASWCQAMEQQMKELETVPATAAKKTESPAIPITPPAPTPAVDVDAGRIKKAAAGNQKFQLPAAASAATGSETFGQPAAEITVISRETNLPGVALAKSGTTEKPEQAGGNAPPANVPKSEKENKMSTEKTDADKGDQTEPERIPMRKQLELLSKQDELLQLKPDHLLVKLYLVSKEDVEFFGKIFPTNAAVEERITLLNEAIAAAKLAAAPPEPNPAAAGAAATEPAALSPPHNAVTDATWGAYLQACGELRGLANGHDLLQNNPITNRAAATDTDILARHGQLVAAIRTIRQQPTTPQNNGLELLRPWFPAIAISFIILFAVIGGIGMWRSTQTTNTVKPSQDLQEVLERIQKYRE